MTAGLSADKKALYLTPGPENSGTVDVLFDDHRVWSVKAPEPDERGRVRLAWPRALTPYLRGEARITVRDSADQHTLATGHVRIGRSSAPIEIKDAQGRFLAMNKWQRLGPSFEGNDTGVQQRLLASGKRLVDDLQDLGYPVYIVGGTLLGAMRSGSMLPHDDDMDLAWMCDETDPLAISLASMRMERELVARGYTAIRLGFAHLQITFFTERGETDHYVDVFTGFYHAGLYCQPFALRGDVPKEELVPTSTVTIDGVEFPAPARPASWLEFAYGPNWPVPDPSFVFVTERGTKRRFENWFGVFNRGRVFWEKRYEMLHERVDAADGSADVDRMLHLLPAGARVLDLGSGDGRLSERIAAAGHPVIAADYSYEALRLARNASGAGAVDYRYLNLNDRHALLGLGFELVDAGGAWWVSLQQVLQSVPKQGRANVFLFLRLILRDEAFAFATVDTNLSPRYERGKPDTWHLPVSWLERESRRFGLEVEVVGTGRRATANGERETATVILRRGAGEGARGPEDEEE